jgi:DNA replication protein DnaD
MKNLNLTQLETVTVSELIKNVDIDINEDSIFSSIETEDLSNFTGIEIKKMRGVVGSLIKKGIVYIEDFDDDGTEIIYLDNEYFYLSNESK